MRATVRKASDDGSSTGKPGHEGGANPHSDPADGRAGATRSCGAPHTCSWSAGSRSSRWWTSQRACGISKAGLYYHFRSKQELLAAIINYAHDILEARDPTRGVTDSRSDEEALRRVIHTHALIMTREDDAAFAILAVDEMRSLLPADRAQIAGRKRSYLDVIRERLERLRRPASCATSTSRPPPTRWPAWCCGCPSGTGSRAGCRPGRWRTSSPSSPCTRCCRMASAEPKSVGGRAAAERTGHHGAAGAACHQQLPESLIEVPRPEHRRGAPPPGRGSAPRTPCARTPLGREHVSRAAGTSTARPDASGPVRNGRPFSHHSRP